jgi:hypothetical protein
MCKIYNTIGSLSTLKSRLRENDIYDFKSLKEVIDFQSSYSSAQQELMFQHKERIEQEKNTLHSELQNLDSAIESQRTQNKQLLQNEVDTLKKQIAVLTNGSSMTILQKLLGYFRHRKIKKEVIQKEADFDKLVAKSIKKLTDTYRDKQQRYNFIISDVQGAIRESADLALTELERKKNTIDGLSSFIYGSIGEQKVVKTLENLSDDYYLINDFNVTFSPAIYHKQENEYIMSVQIDHILIGPSGIFIIETKNWSDHSIGNLNLRSPIQQIKRSSFVFFKLINNEIGNYQLRLSHHHWGEKKIPIRNLIVLTNSKPKEEFQYVKVLTLDELLGYINYFKPAFSSQDTKLIADYLINMNELSVIGTKRYKSY